MNKKEIAKQILTNNGFRVNDDYGFSIERSMSLVEFSCESKSNMRERKENIKIGIGTAGTNLYEPERIAQYMKDYNTVIKCYNELKENDCLEFEITF
jgi:hypothetical protein